MRNPKSRENTGSGQTPDGERTGRDVIVTFELSGRHTGVKKRKDFCYSMNIGGVRLRRSYNENSVGTL